MEYLKANLKVFSILALHFPIRGGLKEKVGKKGELLNGII